MNTDGQPHLRPCAGEAEWPRLVAIWRSSVEATHHFLTAADIEDIQAQLIPTYLPAVEITVAETSAGIVGFSGLVAGKLEMLFVDADARGTGAGSALLRHAMGVHSDLSLDVNEQNPDALGFYAHHGFRVVGRSAIDGDGRPFPLLHLALSGPNDAEKPTVIVVMGVAGTGKSTVGEALAARLGWQFREGDDLHPAANIAKMAAGQALNDADREPWLASVGSWISTQLRTRTPGVITCSALKRRYRDQLAATGVVFVQLQLDQTTIAERLAQRRGHFLDPALLESQLATLEPLTSDESGVVVQADQLTTQIVAEVIDRLGLRLAGAR